MAENDPVTVIVRERLGPREEDIPQRRDLERRRQDDVAPHARGGALDQARARPTPSELTTTYDYVTITLRSGMMDVKGPGTGATGFTDLAHALNVLAGAGYRMISGLSAGPVAIYTLEREHRTV